MIVDFLKQSGILHWERNTLKMFVKTPELAHCSSIQGEMVSGPAAAVKVIQFIG